MTTKRNPYFPRTIVCSQKDFTMIGRHKSGLQFRASAISSQRLFSPERSKGKETRSQTTFRNVRNCEIPTAATLLRRGHDLHYAINTCTCCIATWHYKKKKKPLNLGVIFIVYRLKSGRNLIALYKSEQNVVAFYFSLLQDCSRTISR